MNESKIIMALAVELAKRDVASLKEFVSGMSFVDAFHTLNGFNLSAEPHTIGGKVHFNTFFDVNWKSIATTIFLTEDGGCEVHGACDVWIDDSIHIDNVSI